MGILLFAESISRYQENIMRKIPHSPKFGRGFRQVGLFRVNYFTMPPRVAGLGILNEKPPS
jgi:hypothetical protein